MQNLFVYPNILHVVMVSIHAGSINTIYKGVLSVEFAIDAIV